MPNLLETLQVRSNISKSLKMKRIIQCECFKRRDLPRTMPIYPPNIWKFYYYYKCDETNAMTIPNQWTNAIHNGRIINNENVTQRRWLRVSRLEHDLCLFLDEFTLFFDAFGARPRRIAFAFLAELDCFAAEEWDRHKILERSVHSIRDDRY